MKTHRILILFIAAVIIAGCTKDFTPNIPEVRTLEATEITDCSAMLVGEWSPYTLTFGEDTDIYAYFYISENPDFTEEDKGERQGVTPYSTWPIYHYLYDLTPGTTYYYALALTDGFAEVRGETKSFTTAEAIQVSGALDISYNETGFVFKVELSGIKNSDTFYLEFFNEQYEHLKIYSYTPSTGINGKFEYTIKYSDFYEYFREGYTKLLCRLGYKRHDDEQIVLTDFQEFTRPYIYRTYSELYMYDSETGNYSGGEGFEVYFEYKPTESTLQTISVEGWFDVTFLAGVTVFENNFTWLFKATNEHSFDYSTTREVPDFTANETGNWTWIGDLEEHCHNSGTLFIRNNLNYHYLKIHDGNDIMRL